MISEESIRPLLMIVQASSFADSQFSFARFILKQNQSDIIKPFGQRK
jgi:hypothetical protein